MSATQFLHGEASWRRISNFLILGTTLLAATIFASQAPDVPTGVIGSTAILLAGTGVFAALDWYDRTRSEVDDEQ